MKNVKFANPRYGVVRNVYRSSWVLFEPYGGTGDPYKAILKTKLINFFVEPWFRESRDQQHAARSAVMTPMMSVMCMQVCLSQS